MAETPASILAGKGKRVAGVFLFMIGASIILDTHALWIGLPVLLTGVGVFARGLAEARLRTTTPLAAPPRGAGLETEP